MRLFPFRSFALVFFLSLSSIYLPFDLKALVGTTSFTVAEGNLTGDVTTYYVASAPLSNESVYTGSVAGYDNTNARIIFDVETNSSGGVSYPFSGNSVFVPSVQVPVIKVSVSSGILDTNTSTVWLDEGGSVGFDSNKPGFEASFPPEVILYDADSNISAEVTATVDGTGKLTGLNVVSRGEGYTSTPKVKVVAGSHFVKITDDESPFKGRVFLIEDNNRTRLDIDLSRLANNESNDVSTYFPVGTLIEVIPATTLGSLFGVDYNSDNYPQNWTSGLPSAADWIYLWDTKFGGYVSYFFMNSSRTSRGYSRGWYSKNSTRSGLKNHAVIYPDEAFLIAKRTSGAVTFEFEGEIETGDKKLLLPESGNQILAKNPYGADMMLAELIPSTMIAPKDGNSSLFRAGTTQENSDLVTFLAGSGWEQFWYDHNHGNTAITSMHEIGTRRPLESDSNATTMNANDFYIGSGAVTNIESCDATGDTNASDKTYSKISTTSSIADLKGFTITFTDLQGYLLSEDGTQEINASSGLTTNPGSVVDSNLNGSFEIIASSAGSVVISAQRDVRFSSSLGTPVWNIGKVGSGYTTNAVFYCLGGNTGLDANGTIATNGSITVSSNGSSYSAAPQAIVSGGGWRLSDGATRDNELLGATTGIIIQRNSSSGVKAYIESLNPFE